MGDKKDNGLGSTKPMGIDLEHFNDMTIVPDKDSNLIAELTTPHNNIKDILTKRRNFLRTLSDYWVKGQLDDVFKTLASTNNIGVANDFFNYAFMKNGINKDYLKLEHSIQSLQLVTALVKSKYDGNFKVGIKMVCMLFDMYSSSITMFKRNYRAGQSSEETMLKYEKLINFFDQVTQLDTIKTKNLENDKNLKALLEEMIEFVKTCRRF